MSMVRELIGAVSNTQRQLDDQISKLRSYQSEIDNVTQRVNAALSGSTGNYGQNMLEQLSKTKQTVTETIEKLTVAKDKLSVVQMI